jgi:ribonuclease Y
VITQTVIIIVAALAGAALGIIFGGSRESSKRHELQLKAGRLLKEAKTKVEKIEARANEEVLKLRKELHDLDEDFVSVEENIAKRVDLKREALAKRENKVNTVEQRYNKILEDMKDAEDKTAQSAEELSVALIKKTGLKKDALTEQLKADYENDFRSYFKNVSVQIQEHAKNYAQKDSCKILKSVMQRYVGASSVSPLERNVKVSKDIQKAKFLGKRGVNLAYFEEKTGVNVLIDYEPGYITVAYYNLVKQETARLTLKKIIKKDEINPEVIDAAFEQASAEMEEILYKEGVRAAEIVGIEKRDRELMVLIGRMKYRTSYGQNILYHSIEIAFFCEMLADAIGADTHVAKLAGFYHDIGKAIDQELGEPHDYLSKQILEKFEYPWEIVHAAWTHHDAEPPETVEAQLVKAADALSGSRPGARTESAESYYERVQALEGLALELTGVKKAFAVSGAREIRTFLDEDQVRDSEMPDLAKKLAGEIEENLVYPGKIKVNLIRILNAVEYANNKKNG